MKIFSILKSIILRFWTFFIKLLFNLKNKYLKNENKLKKLKKNEKKKWKKNYNEKKFLLNF